jgi:acetylornithine deacetylase
VIDLLAGWLGDLGFNCEIQQVSWQVQPAGQFRHGPGGLVLAGTATPCLTMRNWQTDPLKLTEVDGRWVGLGSCDMKGFFALVIDVITAGTRLQATAADPRHLR